MWPNNQKGLLSLLRKVKDKYPNKSIWCYTGYTFDKEIMDKMYKENDFTREFLSYIERIIDVKKSIRRKKIVEYKMDREGEKVNA